MTSGVVVRDRSAIPGIPPQRTPFTIAGTASEPVFRPDMKAVVMDQVKNLDGSVGKAAGGLLKGLFGGKKKE